MTALLLTPAAEATLNELEGEFCRTIREYRESLTPERQEEFDDYARRTLNNLFTDNNR